MGLTFNLGRVSPSVFTDSSLNVGIGAAPSGTYKFEVTGTAKVSSTLLVSGAATFSSTLTAGGTVQITGAGSPTIGAGLEMGYGNFSAGRTTITSYNRTGAAYVGNDYNALDYIWYTSGTQKMTITNAGNVGIGTTPSARLEVKQANSLDYRGLLVVDSATPNWIGLAHTGTLGVISVGYDGAGTYYPMSFKTSDTERMRITSAGNVGIGTSSPFSLLQVTSGTTMITSGGDQASNATIEGANVAIGASFTGQLAVLTNSAIAADSGGSIAFGSKYSGNAFAYYAAIKTGKDDSTSGNFGGYLQFATRANGGNVTERMRITSGGDVGIGNNGNASYKLLVSGNNASITTSGTNTIYLSAGTTASFIAASYIGGGSYVPIAFEVGGSERMRIGTAGLLTITSLISTYTTANTANMWANPADGTVSRSTASSLRFKENIKDWDGNGLNTILALKPKTFTYKKEYYNNPELQMLGLIAEEVAEVSPFLAEYENEDRTGQVENVRYATIVVPLIAAIKEMNATITSLQDRLTKGGL